MMLGNVHPARPTRVQRSRGVVLPLVLLTLAIAIILGMCFLTSASTATTLSSAAEHRLRARMIAESGLAMTLTYLEGERDWRAQRANGTWITSQALDDGTFSVSGFDGDHVDATGAVVGDGSLTDDPGDPVLLTCIGEYRGARHVARVVRHPPRPPGLAVSERVELKKTAVVDSYNPALGPYVAATASSKGIAQSNGLARQTYVRLLNRSRVNGDVYYGMDSVLGSAVTRDATAVVTGSIAPLPAPVPTTDIVEPNWANNTGVPRAYSTGAQLVTTDTWYKSLELRGDAFLRVIGDVKIYVGGDMTVGDDARIEIGNPMAHAAAIKGTINISSTVPIDSYDSSLGAYGGTNVDSKAVIATNSAAAAAVTVQSAIKGDVYSGAGSIPATSIVVLGGSVSGTRAALTAPMTIPAPPPWPTDVPANVGYYEVKDTTRNLAANLQTDDMVISGNGVLRVSGDRKIRINGNFLLDGNGQIEIAANSSLKLYVGGQIRMTGNGSAANTVRKTPQSFIIYGMGSGYTHLLDGNAVMYGIIDAPNSTIQLDGNTHLYGAIMASSLITRSNAALHNDRNPALVDANPRLVSLDPTGSRLTLYTNGKLTLRQRARLNSTTMNPALATVYHLGPQSLEVLDNSAWHAGAYAPHALISVLGASRWTGRIDARSVVVGGTSVVTADASGGTARPAVLVEETVELRDDAVLNATGGTALLASRGYTDSTIRVTDTAAFKGDGYTAPAGNPLTEIRVGAAATFTGVKGTQVYPVTIAALTAPVATAPVTDWIANGTTTSTLSGDVFCANFELRDDAVVEVNGNVRLIVSGDVKLFDNARLVLRPQSRLTIHCAGTVQVCENAQINVDGHPRQLVISCPATPRIDVRDAAKLCATVLAPVAELSLNHTAEFYGSFAGRRAKIDRSAKFHCAQPTPGPLIWIEQE